jgi:hypothetical protein
MTRSYIRCIIALVALCCMPQFTRAVAVVYTTLPTFQAAAGSTTLEDFESGVGSIAAPVVVGAITVTDPNGGDGVFHQQQQVGTGRAIRVSTNVPTAPTVQFSFASAITAIGFDILDLGTINAPTTLSFVLSNGDVGNLVAGYSGSFNNQIFAGVVSSSAFNSITLTNSAQTDYIEFDNARYAVANIVPLPAAAWLGFALIGGIGAKRAARKTKNELSIA